MTRRAAAAAAASRALCCCKTAVQSGQAECLRWGENITSSWYIDGAHDVVYEEDEQRNTTV